MKWFVVTCAKGAVVGAMLSMGAVTYAAEYHVDTEAARRVVFVSDAPIESIEGVTESIDGYLMLSSDVLTPGTDLSGSSFYFEVDLNSLDTGIGLRNRHMRENYLHTEDHPYAQFKGSVDSITAVSDSVFLAYTAGELTIHGVTRERSIVDTVTVRDGHFQVTSGFPVALPDHDIEVPKLMFLKINEVVELQLMFTLRLSDTGGQEE